MASQAELIQQFAAKKLSLKEVVAQIGSASSPKRSDNPARSLADAEKDPDPAIGESAGVQLYVALSRGEISQSDYDAIYAALSK